MAQEAQLGLGIGRRGMRGIRPALAREIHTGERPDHPSAAQARRWSSA